jgi:hypothetical protein
MRRIGATAAGCAAAVLGLAACASSADGGLDGPREPIATTPAALSGAIDAAAGGPYRYVLSIEVGSSVDDPDATEVLHATGEVDGDMVWVHADLSAHVPERDIPDGMTIDDLFVETIAGPDVLYARSPLAAATELPDLAPDDVVEIVGALSDGWVSVDVGALDGIRPMQVSCLLVGVGADPGDLLEIAREVTAVERGGAGSGDDGDSDEGDSDEADVKGGPEEIDGIPADVLVGDVPLAVVDPVGQPDAASTADLGPLADLTVPVEVWVDADGVVHRVRLTRDLGEVADALVEAGDLPAAAAAGVPVVTYTADLSDHGDDAIEITAPDDAVDVTEPFTQFLDRLDQVPTGLGSMADALAELEATYDALADWDAELEASMPELPEMEEYPSFEELYPEYADGPPQWEDFDPGPVEPFEPLPPEPFEPDVDLDQLEQDMAEWEQDMADIEQDLADLEEQYGPFDE